MAITVELDGRFRNKITKVNPNDIVLQGKRLSVKGIQIPVTEDRLYDLFFYLEKAARYKHGKVSVALLSNGDIKVNKDTSNNTADYYATRILEFGTDRNHYEMLPRRPYGVPSDGEMLIGKDSEAFY